MSFYSRTPFCGIQKFSRITKLSFFSNPLGSDLKMNSFLPCQISQNSTVCLYVYMCMFMCSLPSTLRMCIMLFNINCKRFNQFCGFMVAMLLLVVPYSKKIDVAVFLHKLFKELLLPIKEGKRERERQRERFCCKPQKHKQHWTNFQFNKIVLT